MESSFFAEDDFLRKLINHYYHWAVSATNLQIFDVLDGLLALVRVSTECCNCKASDPRLIGKLAMWRFAKRSLSANGNPVDWNSSSIWAIVDSAGQPNVCKMFQLFIRSSSEYLSMLNLSKSDFVKFRGHKKCVHLGNPYIYCLLYLLFINNLLLLYTALITIYFLWIYLWRI